MHISSGQNTELPWRLICKILSDYWIAILSPEENLCSSDFNTYLWRITFHLLLLQPVDALGMLAFLDEVHFPKMNSNRNAFYLGL